jgi:transcriptional regulator with XRE-family HTH domain
MVEEVRGCAAIARKAGIDKAAVSRWLRGLRRPSRMAQEKLIRAGIFSLQDVHGNPIKIELPPAKARRR